VVEVVPVPTAQGAEPTHDTLRNALLPVPLSQHRWHGTALDSPLLPTAADHPAPHNI